jgi:hypothetical protein
MTWSLAECLQYRTAAWQLEDRATVPLARHEAAADFASLAG